MPWFKVDDTLHAHPKVRRAGLASMGLWVAAGSYAMSYATGGFVPRWFVTGFTNGSRAAHALLTAGLWTESRRDGEEGYQFHDWEHYQPTREEIEQDRENARQRQRRLRAKRREAAGKGPSVTPPVTRDIQRDQRRESRDPDPTRPDPTISIETFAVGGTSVTRSNTRPPAKCAKHINSDSDAPCRACGDARRAHDTWQRPTLSAKTTPCGDHPEHPALHCPACAAEVKPAPKDWRNSA